MLDRAEIFFHYVRGLEDAKAGSVKKGKKARESGVVRERGDKAADKDESGGKDDVGEHVVGSGDRPTDVARG